MRTFGGADGEQKLQGPTTLLSFLGIKVDTMAMELRLPQEKLSHLKGMDTGLEGEKIMFKARVAVTDWSFSACV